MDEVDTIFSKGKDDRNEELRGLLNAGQRRGVPAYRCGGPKMTEVKQYDAFCAVALAGIGDLPSTIADRSLRIEMKRRAAGEQVERFRRRRVTPKAKAVKKRVASWAAPRIDELAGAEPDLPDELDDRAQDGWEPLLAIADAAGGDWPARARRAALELSAGRTAEDDTIGVRLLADIATVFGGADRLSSADLATRLAGLEEAPWGDWYGHPLDARGLAKKLKPFDIRPRKVASVNRRRRATRGTCSPTLGRVTGPTSLNRCLNRNNRNSAGQSTFRTGTAHRRRPPRNRP